MAQKRDMVRVLLLPPAWAVAGASCTRLCLAAVGAATVEENAGRGHDLTLYEAGALARRAGVGGTTAPT